MILQEETEQNQKKLRKSQRCTHQNQRTKQESGCKKGRNKWPLQNFACLMTEFSNPDKLEKDANRIKQNGRPCFRTTAMIKENESKHHQKHGKIDCKNKKSFFAFREYSQAKRCCKRDTTQTKAYIAEEYQKHFKHYFSPKTFSGKIHKLIYHTSDYFSRKNRKNKEITLFFCSKKTFFMYFSKNIMQSIFEK